MMYTACRYAPEELFAGFDEPCQRLDPGPASFSCADACGHPNLCGFAKGVMEEVLSGEVRRLVLTDCCDAMRRVFDDLKKAGNMEFLFLLPLPHKTGPDEIERYAAALKELCGSYSLFTGKTFSEEKARAAFIQKSRRPEGKYIRIAGAHGGSALKQLAETVFSGLPVVDDTCSGNRNVLPPGPGDFFSGYAASLLKQDGACMRMWQRDEQLPDDRCIGTVFHTMKFCDYYSFAFLPQKRETALLKIETDGSRQSPGQLLTRLEAFRETLGVTAMKTIKRKKEKVYAAGIDSGSTSTDAVILDESGNLIASVILPTGRRASESARHALETVLEQASLQEDDLSVIVTTGYGRNTVGLQDVSVTEITCHARGAHHLFPEARTVIDIGGQDSKVIRLDESGNVINFVMNDKCAAGTGRFLEMQARAMELTMEEMSEAGLHWQNDVSISNMCTVFAESEVVSLVATDTPPADIIHGLNKSVAERTVSLIRRSAGSGPFIMTGGVAANQGVVQCLQDLLKEEVFVSPYAQLCGSIGAALLGLDSLENKDI